MKKQFLVNCIIFLFAFSAIAQEGTIITNNQNAPNFTVTTGDKKIQLSDLKGKVILINFFATWCGPCLQELPVLQKTIWEKYKDNPNFSLLIIGRGHVEDELDKFKKSKNFVMPFYPDFDKSIYSLFASKLIPRNFIIDKNGVVRYSSIGYEPEEFKKMTDFLDDLLNMQK